MQDRHIEPLSKLRQAQPAPDTTGIKPYRFALDGGGKHIVTQRFNADKPTLLLEVGVFLGGSCINWLEATPDVTVIGVDPWSDSYDVVASLRRYWDSGSFTRLFQHIDDFEEFVESLGVHGFYRSAVANLKQFGDRFIPYRGVAPKAFEEISALGVEPDIVYIDADKTSSLIYSAATYFPKSIICGDDWTWNEKEGFPVQKIVNEYAQLPKQRVIASGATWLLTD